MASRTQHTPGTRRIALYIPSRRKSGKKIAGVSGLTRSLEYLLCERFDGVTSYPAVGLYRGARGVIREPVQVLEFYVDRARWRAGKAWFLRLTAALGSILSQDSIAFSEDGGMTLVSPAGRRKGTIPRSEPRIRQLLEEMTLDIKRPL